MKVDLNGKTAVITGGGSKTARAAASELLKNGAAVILADSDEKRAKRFEKDFSQYAEKVFFAVLDPRSGEKIYADYEKICEKHNPDILINCVKDTPEQKDRALIHETDMKRYDKIISSEVTGLYYTVKAALQRMVENNSGVIINITSVLGIVPRIGLSVNSACAAAAMSLIKVWALELDKTNIRLHTIARGEYEEESSLKEEAAISHQSVKRAVTPEDVAQAVLFLCSPGAEMQNGEITVVSGGIDYGYMRTF